MGDFVCWWLSLSYNISLNWTQTLAGLGLFQSENNCTTFRTDLNIEIGFPMYYTHLYSLCRKSGMNIVSSSLQIIQQIYSNDWFCKLKEKMRNISEKMFVMVDIKWFQYFQKFLCDQICNLQIWQECKNFENWKFL